MLQVFNYNHKKLSEVAKSPKKLQKQKFTEQAFNFKIVQNQGSATLSNVMTILSHDKKKGHRNN